jgi:hypothetical protein
VLAAGATDALVKRETLRKLYGVGFEIVKKKDRYWLIPG